MRVLVPIKRVVDYNVKIRVKSDGSGVDTQQVKMSMNPFDENAVEAALQLKEAGVVDHVTVISIGEQACQETLRAGLAFGADDAVHIETPVATEPLSVAKCLAAYLKDNPVDITILGKQAIDDDCNQTGQMLAGLMNWPQATYASKITIEGEEAIVTREVDAGLETIAVKLPAVITVDLRINQPRYPSMPNIMKAKSKPLSVIAASSFDVDLTPRITALTTVAPPVRSGGFIVSDINELIGKLHEEDRVL